jgi:hypothetical protein
MARFELHEHVTLRKSVLTKLLLLHNGSEGKGREMVRADVLAECVRLILGQGCICNVLFRILLGVNRQASCLFGRFSQWLCEND